MLPLLTDWSGGFSHLLDQCRAAAEQAPHAGIGAKAVFGQAFTQMRAASYARSPTSLMTRLLRDGLRQYLEDHPEIAVHERFGAGLGIAEARFLNADTASTELGLGHRRLKRMVKSFPGVVERSVIGPSGRARTILSRAHLASLVEESSEIVTTKWVVGEIGIGHKGCQDLVKSGLLTPVERELGRITAARARRDVDCFYRRSDVQALLDRLCGGLPAAAPSGRLVGLHGFLIQAGKLGVTLLQVFQSLGTGALCPRGIDPELRGLARLLFDRNEVSVFLAGASAPRFGSSLTLAEAARELGWYPAHLRVLLKSGLAKADRYGRAKRAPLLVTREEVARLQAEYVTAGDLARQQGTSQGIMLRRLRDAGIPNVLSSLEQNPPGALFRKADVGKVELNVLLQDVGPQRKLPPKLPTRDISDREWRILERLVEPVSSVEDPIHDWRSAFDGMIYVIRTGCDWKCMPSRYGSPKLAFQQLRFLASEGVWRKALAHLREYGPIKLERRVAAIVEYSALFHRPKPQ
jgi:transposase